MIKKFLKLKYTKAFKDDDNKMLKYPIDYVDTDGYVKQGFIQDVVEEIQGNAHILTVVILSEDKTKLVEIEKTCKAAKGCTVDWDSVHCAYTIL